MSFGSGGDNLSTASSFSDRARRLSPQEFVEICSVPEGPYDNLLPVSTRIVLTYANYQSHIARHPEMESMLEHIPVSVSDPHEVFVTQRNPDTANAVREIENGVFVVVSVWISPYPELGNSVHSFRRYGLRTMRKVRAKHHFIWSKRV